MIEYNMFIRKILSFLFLVGMFLHANSDGVCYDTIDQRTFHDSVRYFNDTTGILDGSDILDIGFESFYKPKSSPSHLGLSFDDPMLWGTFSTAGSCRNKEKIYLFVKNITMKNMRLFVETDGSLEEIEKIQDMHAFVFLMALENQRQRYYFQIEGDGPYIVDGKFHTDNQLSSAIFKDIWFFAIFTGLIFSVTLFFIIFFLMTRHRIYLYFSLHILSHLLLWLSIFGVVRALFPSIELSDVKFLAVTLSSIFLAMLAINFLDLKNKTRLCYKIMIVLLSLIIAYYGLAYYFEIFVFYAPLFGFLKFLLYITILVALAKAICLKVEGALYFFLGVGIYVIGHMITIIGLFVTGVLPVNAFTINAGMFSIIIDIFFLSFVLARNMKQLNNENNRLLRDYNETLKAEVAQRTKEIEINNELLRKLSITDTLTQVNNRLKLDEILVKRYEAFQKDRDAFIHIMMIDADDFKEINDNYGHLVGDDMLKIIASIIKKSVKEDDVVGRWGGEEFMVISETKSKDAIEEMAQRVRENISKYKNDKNISLSISIGIATLKEDDLCETWVHRADEALYRAKANGKNCVEIA